MTEARAKAWNTRREKYGERGHSGAYQRPPSAIGRRALDLVLRLHDEATLSEGQCCAHLDLSRVEFRRMHDDWRQRHTPALQTSHDQ
mgnify:CR=1 FL=1